MLSILLVISIILLTGLRAYTVGTDTGNYYREWLRIKGVVVTTDFIYYYIMFTIKKIGLSYQHFLFLISTIFFLVIYKSLKNLSESYGVNLYLIIFCFLSFFFSLTLSINVVRQGLSLAFLLLAYSYLISNQSKRKIIIFSIISLFFHLTAIIPIFLFVIATLTKRLNLNLFVCLYFIGVLLAYLNYGILDHTSFLSEILQNDKRLSYVTTINHHYIVGFKFQFVIFNTIFLIISLYIFKVFQLGSIYKTGIIYYILSSFMFFMAFQLSFSDRWGLFSWIFLPVLLVPLFSIQIIRKIYYLFFTLLLIGIFVFFNIYE